MTLAVHHSCDTAALRETPFATGPQGQRLANLIHQGVADGCRSAMRAVIMPGGHMAGAHRHPHHEVQVLVLQGYAASLVGEDMRPVLHRAGEAIRIPPGVPHAAVNLSASRPVTAIETITDPYSGDVALMPELDAVAEQVADQLRGERAREVVEYEGETIEQVFASLMQQWSVAS
ncbi:cupin domain-containing protein [Saccharopolyspora griseoalba]|uniref:Cupin domain-containing protein n=1 Tax=Saccharopolyspora griseoalba TaxID=1431848 RepID=A0ABW2LPS8_9PSEU